MHAISWAVNVEVADDLPLPDEGKGYFSMDSCVSWAPSMCSHCVTGVVMVD